MYSFENILMDEDKQKIFVVYDLKIMDFIFIGVFEIKIFLKKCEVVLKRKKEMCSNCFLNYY